MDLLSALSNAPQGSDSRSAQHGPDQAECSRKACRSAAQWQILWNNPKIHTPERRKIWLACGEHREWLENFLQQRLFWRSTEPMSMTEPMSSTEPMDGADSSQSENSPEPGA